MRLNIHYNELDIRARADTDFYIWHLSIPNRHSLLSKRILSWRRYFIYVVRLAHPGRFSLFSFRYRSIYFSKMACWAIMYQYVQTILAVFHRVLLTYYTIHSLDLL